MLGDFNEVLYTYETEGPRPRPPSQMQSFRHTLDELNMTEVYMEQAVFTWWNQQQRDVSVRVKLDRYLGNPAFHNVVPTRLVTTLPVITSDHHAIKLVFLQPRRDSPGLKVTRLEPWWFQYEEVTHLIKEPWTLRDQATPQLLLHALAKLTTSLRRWSSRKFGVIPKEVSKLRRRLLTLESVGGNDEQIQLCYNKLQELTNAENEYWQQRSRSNWLQSGDQNISYFHHHASHRRKQNRITKVKDENDNLVLPQRR